jgi:hypothetical protein
MTCKICVEHYRDKLNLPGSSKKHLFIAGFKNYKISTVSDHEKSCVHIDAVRSNKITKQASTQQTTAHKTVMALKEHTRKDLELKFRNVHALIKKTSITVSTAH